MSEYHAGLIIGFCVGSMFTSSFLTVIYMSFRTHYKNYDIDDLPHREQPSPDLAH